MNELWAVLPAKGFSHAKSRLGEVLSDAVRASFARGLFEHVLATLQATTAIRAVLVLTDDDEVEQLARARGAQVLRDEPGLGLSQIIDAGLARVQQLGAQAALVCMADLPLVNAEELALVAQELREHEVLLAPDTGEAGTNLLALRPPTLFESCFGHADSFRRHRARAEERGHGICVLRARGLCFDVDGPQDLEQLDR
jgi:2-phospho-L-lactate guanylyltransferase